MSFALAAAAGCGRVAGMCAKPYEAKSPVASEPFHLCDHDGSFWMSSHIEDRLRVAYELAGFEMPRFHHSSVSFGEVTNKDWPMTDGQRAAFRSMALNLLPQTFHFQADQHRSAGLRGAPKMPRGNLPMVESKPQVPPTVLWVVFNARRVGDRAADVQAALQSLYPAVRVTFEEPSGGRPDLQGVLVLDAILSYFHERANGSWLLWTESNHDPVLRGLEAQVQSVLAEGGERLQ